MNQVPGEHRGNTSFCLERRIKEGERCHRCDIAPKVTINNGTEPSSIYDGGMRGGGPDRQYSTSNRSHSKAPLEVDWNSKSSAHWNDVAPDEQVLKLTFD